MDELLEADRGTRFSQPASIRLAPLIAATWSSPTDPRSFHAWGRCSAASRGALRDWCRAADEKGRDVIAFTRLLRAAKAAHDERRREPGPVSPHLFLDITDDRHRRALNREGGPPLDRQFCPRTSF